MSNRVSLVLAYKEVWRNRGRYLLVSMVIALITLLVLFLAGLGEGLGNGNKEYLSKLDGELILFRDGSNLSVAASQFGRATINDARRVPGVADAGPIGVAQAFVQLPDADPLSVSMIGVEPGRPGDVPAFEGRGLSSARANEVVLDRFAALRSGLTVGDTLTIKSTQASVDEFYTLEVVGLSDGRQYSIQPSIFVPLLTWDRIRPKAVVGGSSADLVYNVIAVRLDDPAAEATVAAALEERLSDVVAVDRRTAYENAPGYTAQQSTIRTQQAFTLLIGVLVVGGFFQIQTLQKVAQVGVLKALGASNRVVAVAASLQIITTNVLGVALGALAAFGLAAVFPPTVPIVFVGAQAGLAIATLLLIGPLGGLVSIRYLTRVEPLRALGLAQ